ncbi:MAG: peptidoglycan DD-metalloendopeptidase family protein [Gammaproteobacteria bacterium]|nr:peptidoglycan DD-metalloendopeptidase family protein [Gammaproteobacteria bacterium]
MNLEFAASNLCFTLVVCGVAACTARVPPLVVERSVYAEDVERAEGVEGAEGVESAAGTEDPGRDRYRVHRGDSLYSIAWRLQLDYLELARLNGLRAPYVIHPGQVLQLDTSAARMRTAPPGAEPGTSRPRNAPEPPPEPSPEPSAELSPEPKPPSNVARWVWPVEGAADRRYDARRNGIDYQLRSGSKVVAAAAGEVVYAGDGLGGYAHLVIVKHDGTYLSAYSLNVKPRAQEGGNIKAGAKLADIKGSDAITRRFHFEIRRMGKPVDPRTVIEPR